MEEPTGIGASVSPPEKARVIAAPCGAGLLCGPSRRRFTEAECWQVGTPARVTVMCSEEQDRRGSGVTPWSSVSMAGGPARRLRGGGRERTSLSALVLFPDLNYHS